MNRKSVAALDVESSAVTALIGERGVNNTFVFKGIHTHPYDGFAEAEFFDVRGLQQAARLRLTGTCLVKRLPGWWNLTRRSRCGGRRCAISRWPVRACC